MYDFVQVGCVLGENRKQKIFIQQNKIVCFMKVFSFRFNTPSMFPV